MTSSQTRAEVLQLVDQAIHQGARVRAIAQAIELSERTLRRWRKTTADRRPTAQRATPIHALSQEERQAVLTQCNLPENKDKPPGQIVPALADQGLYLASESTFYRVLKANSQLNHRGRARAPKSTPKPVHTATAPNQVWVWDITYLKTSVAGIYLYLYIIMDLHSRKIVAHETWEAENAEHSKALLRRACLSENIAASASPVILHGDNGSPLKAGTVIALMEFLGITPSHSRPRVSNDNAFAEAIMRTAKYNPTLPPQGFGCLYDARVWADQFVQYYNGEHRHSALRFVTPNQKHNAQDVEILKNRASVYQKAKAKNPHRWIRGITRNWQPVGATSLTPIDPYQLEKTIKKSA